jgi:hypothetical protein
MIEEEREDETHREIERCGDDPRFEGSAGGRGDLVDRNVSSWTEIKDTIAESLTRLMNCPPSGGRIRCKACGRITSASTRLCERPIARAASH